MRVAAAILLLVPLSSCCSISQGLTAIFCGTNTDPFVEKSWITPDAARQTLLGAISRDDPTTIYECLGPDLKERMGVGEVEVVIAWRKIQEQVPGIHIADQAKVSEPIFDEPDLEPLKRTRVRYLLELPSTRIEVALRRHDYWRVVSQGPGAERPEADGDYAPLPTIVQLHPRGMRTGVELKLPGPMVAPLEHHHILQVTAGREWLVDSLRNVED